MLKIENVTKVFPNGVRALDNVSVEIQDGEFVAIVGLSGAGKSTLLRCVNRLVEPTSGRILLDGINITAASPSELRRIRRKIGMIFQQFNLVKRSSVLTNVLSGSLGSLSPWESLVGHFPEGAYRGAYAALARVGIPEKAFERADSLSGGQQQRVGIARALIQDPLIILADEPVASLDPATSHSVMKYLEQVNREDGIIVLCNIHFLSLARRYATRVLALKDGRLVFDGLPKDIGPERFRQIYGEEAIEVEVA